MRLFNMVVYRPLMKVSLEPYLEYVMRIFKVNLHAWTYYWYSIEGFLPYMDLSPNNKITITSWLQYSDMGILVRLYMPPVKVVFVPYYGSTYCELVYMKRDKILLSIPLNVI